MEDLYTYWRRSPPANEMVAAYLGIGSDAPAPPLESASLKTEDDARRLADALNAMVRGGPGA